MLTFRRVLAGNAPPPPAPVILDAEISDQDGVSDTAALVSGDGQVLSWVGGSGGSRRGNLPRKSGKWYFEAVAGGTALKEIGIIPVQGSISGGGGRPGISSVGYGYRSDGVKENNNIQTAYGATYTANDVIGCAVDMDTKKVWFHKNGTWQGGGDPVLGTGEAFTFSFTNSAYPAFSVGGNPANWTSRFKESEQVYRPAGFGGWANGPIEEVTFAAALTANGSLSNGNKTLTGTSGTGGLSSADLTRTRGKYYFELVAGAVGTFSAVGVNMRQGGFGANYIEESGAVPGGTNQLPWGPGDVIGVAVDMSVAPNTEYIWFSKNGVFNTGDPVAGTGPHRIIGSFNGCEPWFEPWSTGNSGTIRLRASEFSSQPPAGFLPWDSNNL